MSHGGDLWFFDRVAGLYDLFMYDADPAALWAGLDRAGRDVERVADVAGGSGRASAAIDAPEQVVVDASVPMLRRAAARDLPAVAGDAARLPLAEDSVDAVVIADAAHHLPDLGAAFADAARALRPGGVVVVREFDPETIRGRGIAVGERLLRMDSTFHPQSDLLDLLARAGLDAEVVRPGWEYTAVGVAPGGE